ncbi:MAG: XRE family transcriptional regulator [Clostridia bacterium]|nr:XRE family transcriptional regulator [Clostridia bacterium]
MDNNKEIGNRIKTRREELHLTQEEIGKRLNLNKSTILRYENGTVKKIKLPILQAVAEVLNVDPDYLALKTDTMGKFVERVKTAVKIPVLGYVKAGIPIEAIEEILDYEEISSEMASKGDYFGLTIKGDSMEPKFSDGDVVIVKQQETVDNGDIAVVIVNGSNATIKKFYKLDSGIKLISTNPSYDPFFYTPEEVNSLPVQVIGKVVELRAKF